MLHFDWTISIGNILMAGSFLIAAIMAWNDLRWRVSNLETWQRLHTKEDEKRDELIARIDKLISQFEALYNAGALEHERFQQHNRWER